MATPFAWINNIFYHPCPNCENWTTENIFLYLPVEERKKFRSKLFDRHLFHCFNCGIWFREK